MDMCFASKFMMLSVVLGVASSWAVRVFPDVANRLSPANPDREARNALWTKSGKLLMASPGVSGMQIFTTTDRGASWLVTAPRFTAPSAVVGGGNLLGRIGEGKNGTLLTGVTGFIITTAITMMHGVASSTDEGATWNMVDTNSLGTGIMAAPNGDVFAWRFIPGGPPGGLFHSADNGVTWDSLAPKNFQSGAIGSDGTIYIHAGGFLPGQNAGWTYGFRSTDNGATWQSLGRLTTVVSVYDIAVDAQGNALFGMGNSSAAYASKSDTTARIFILPAGAGNPVFAVGFDGSGNWLAAVDYWGIFFSQDQGVNWTKRNSGIDTTTRVGLFSSAADGSAYFSTSKGLYYIDGTGTPILPFSSFFRITRNPNRLHISRVAGFSPHLDLLGRRYSPNSPSSLFGDRKSTRLNSSH